MEHHPCQTSSPRITRLAQEEQERFPERQEQRGASCARRTGVICFHLRRSLYLCGHYFSKDGS